MADISRVSRLVDGVQRGVDLSTNTLVVDKVKVGGGAGTDLSKTILDRLVSLQNGSDVDASYHTHDGRYFTESELGSSSASSGSDLIGDDDTYSNFNPTAATVKGALAGIDSALASAGSSQVKVSADDTTPGYLEGKIVAGAGLSSSVLNDGADEDLNLAVNVDDSTIEINTDALRVKDAGITNAKIATGVDAAKIADGSVSNAEFQYLANVTSDIQSQFTGKQSTSEKGQANGYASLDGSGKVPVAQLPSAVMTYEGVWNASTNSPSLADGAGDAGMVYRVGTAGSQDLGSGSISFSVGDYVIYNGSTWEKSDTTDAVASVNGMTGIVVLDSDDISEGSSNLYFSDERAQDAVGTILADSATIDFTYNDGTPSIVADVKSNSISESHLTASVAGAGLTGGNGSALAVGAGDGIDVAADAISVDVSDLAGSGLENDGSNNLRIAASAAGAGLTGGAGSALAVGAGNGIQVNADSVEVLHSPAIKNARVAGESMAANTSFLVRWAVNGETAGRVYKADKDASSSNLFYAFGIALKTSAVSAGDSVDVISEGTHILGSSDTPFNAADIGKPVYLTSSGAFSITPPSAVDEAVWRVGMVQAVDRIWVGDKQLNGIN